VSEGQGASAFGASAEGGGTTAIATDGSSKDARDVEGDEPRARASTPAGSIQSGPPASSSPDQRAQPPQPAARSSGASAALEVLRSAGLRVSTDRTRAIGGAAKAPGGAYQTTESTTRSSERSTRQPAAQPTSPSAGQAADQSADKPARPRAAVPVREPRPHRDDAAASRQTDNASQTPPWDDAPMFDGSGDDYVPLTADDAYFAVPDEPFSRPASAGGGYAPVSEERGSTPAAIDLDQLPPAVTLDALGFAGDWPALAAQLPLTGVAHQLAFNSELTTLDGDVLRLIVPVPQYAEGAPLAKLKAALAERLGKAVEVRVEVGRAQRTAAAIAAAARAARQREAEREIGADPFVQSLIREFGATIIPGSVRPIAPDAGTSP
jgi:DNA polymerase-3 subunit gamma/tau